MRVSLRSEKRVFFILVHPFPDAGPGSYALIVKTKAEEARREGCWEAGGGDTGMGGMQ